MRSRIVNRPSECWRSTPSVAALGEHESASFGELAQPVVPRRHRGDESTDGSSRPSAASMLMSSTPHLPGPGVSQAQLHRVLSIQRRQS